MPPKLKERFKRRLGKALRERREAAGMSLTAFAEAMDVAIPTASDWERGRYSPAVTNLGKAAALLSCTVDELLAEAA